MLTEKEIYSFKLASGEEMLARVVSHEGDIITISQPVSITPTERGMALVPSMFTSNPTGDFMLNINTVSMYAISEEQMQDKYIEAVTGIKIPEKKLILG